MPNIEDFKKGGRFYKLRFKKTDKNLPFELYRFVFPDYSDHIFNSKTKPKQKTINLIREYCISLKKEVIKEEKHLLQKTMKEIETKHLEEKIRDYFDNYYKNFYKNAAKNVS